MHAAGASPAGRVRGPRRQARQRARLPLERSLWAMKGLVLAGGTATRLFPLTIVTNKHLLPIYDRPMIYYPLDTLAGMGIREVMVIVGGKSVGDIVELLGDGRHFGLDLTYRYQRGALGIAHAIGLARDFIGDDSFCVVLGDNILRGGPLEDTARSFDGGAVGRRARCCTRSRTRSGSASRSSTRTATVVGFEEKPAQPKSDLIPIGVYFLRPDAFDVIETLAPSGRGEFEITDVLNHYIPDGGLFTEVYDGHWADAGHRAEPAAGRRARRGRRRRPARCPPRRRTRTTRSDRPPDRRRSRRPGRPPPGHRRRRASSAASSSAGSSAGATGRAITVLDKLTYAGNRANLAAVEADAEPGPATSRSSRATSPTRTSVGAARRRRGRGRQRRRRDARRPHRSSTPRPSCGPASSASTCCSRRSAARPSEPGRRARGGAAIPPGQHRRGLRRRRRGPVASRPTPSPRAARTPPPRPRRAARPRVPRDVRARRRDHARLEHVRPVPAPREAHPAVRDQRARGRAAADVRRRDAGPRLAPRLATTRRASSSCSAMASRARRTTCAGENERPNREVIGQLLAATGPRLVAGPVRARPARATTGGTRWTARRRRRSAGARRVAFESGLPDDRRLVPRQRRRGSRPRDRGDWDAYYDAPVRGPAGGGPAAVERGRLTDAGRGHRRPRPARPGADRGARERAVHRHARARSRGRARTSTSTR